MRALEPTIYHLALATDWDSAKARTAGYTMSTLGVSLAQEGFIHCSFSDQVQRIADLVYRERDDVVLLTLDPARLTSPVRVDAVGADAFPHVYGPINVSAVLAVRALPVGPDGRLDTGLGAPLPQIP